MDARGEGGGAVLLVEVLASACFPGECEEEVHDDHVVRLGRELHFDIPFAIQGPEDREAEPADAGKSQFNPQRREWQGARGLPAAASR